MQAETSEDDGASATARRSVTFLRAADHWRFEFQGETFYLRDSKGIRYLVLLVESPGQKFTLDQLAAAGEDADTDARAADPYETFRRRLQEIRVESETAAEWNDIGRREWMRMEVERMADSLERRGGEDRDEEQAAEAERSRKRIANLLRRAIGSVAKYSPLLGAHLGISVRTGLSVRYLPDPLSGIRWNRRRTFETMSADRFESVRPLQV